MADDTTPKTGPIATPRKRYEAYLKRSGGLTWDKKPCPLWDDVGDAVRQNWEAAHDLPDEPRFTMLVAASCKCISCEATITRGELLRILPHPSGARGICVHQCATCAAKILLPLFDADLVDANGNHP
jgi:hypothetical protein